jgi:hypothetical protein
MIILDRHIIGLKIFNAYIIAPNSLCIAGSLDSDVEAIFEQ